MSRRLLWWLATLAVTAGGAVLAAWAPSGDGPVLCLFQRLLALPCPGCGLTRAFAHLAGGELRAALALHPLSPVLALELAAGWGLAGLVLHGVAPPPRRLAVERWVAATGFLLVAVWMGRLAIGDLTAVSP